MASLRISLINEAKQLAAAADLVGSGHGYHVPAATIERIHRRLRCVDEPVKILEWAWRWQRARHDESGWRVDGLAALYLLAALIDLQRTAKQDSDWRDHEPIREPVHEPVREAVREPVHQAVREPVHQAVREPVREPVRHGQVAYTLAHVD